ncbi:aldo/keto reductase [Arthrobacter crystallopoietes BAB-32]|uniref:Aldo/keto reductase n=1 Tax=Arthrobacter crystallopoietes BAB-32 TaxID=1246476 RepID=N1V6E4_9MICC|nr:aldo/keto reductase [Arthrobacter crystallopoietes]EMY33788.1 aldo/keto reductase [Arthrobacter crystallopoietes BAB-32]
MTRIPAVVLNNGVSIPQLGFGVFQVLPGETQEAVEAALEAGYRHIDTAAAYRNEAAVGRAIRASGLPREELFITTKLRNGEQHLARQAFDNSLAELRLDYVDLYLIHWPVPSQGLYVRAWKELEKIHSDGGARAIGVSNFLPEHLEALAAEAQTTPAVNQLEIHPSLQQAAAVQKSRELGLAVQAYSPLGQGVDLDQRVITSLAAERGATPAQIILAWHLAQGIIAIPKTVNPGRMAENLAAAGIELTAEEIAAVSGLEAGNRVGADPARAAFSQL